MIDRRFVEADLKIVTGLVEPHFMAGYSGGRKVVAPGVAYQDTILMFHRARILEHCKAANCIIEGNPLHNEQIEIVRAIGGVVAVNVVIDEERRLGFVNFGEVEASHARAVEFMRKYAEIRIPAAFQNHCDHLGRVPPGQDLLPDGEGHGWGHGHSGARGELLSLPASARRAWEVRNSWKHSDFFVRSARKDSCPRSKSRDKALIDEWETEMLLKPLRVGRIQMYTTGLYPAGP